MFWDVHKNDGYSYVAISNLALCFYKNATLSSSNEDEMDKVAIEKSSYLKSVERIFMRTEGNEVT